MPTALEQSSARLKAWVIDRALPLWAERGQRGDGSWVEHLHLDGTPDLSAERRWRVLARQIYVYAEATRLGWYGGEDIARRTYEHMRKTGYVQRVTSKGQVTERRRDLYDHAFYLLASAALYRLTGEAQYLSAADDILETLDIEFAHENGGWRETPRGLLPRRQNPHMHLLEASLYLFSETRKAKHLSYAKRVYDLFAAHFFDTSHHTIREFFNEDWSLLKGEKGRTAEPGHGMAWVWLLRQFEKQSGVSTRDYQDKLYNRAVAERGWFLNDEEGISGNIRRESKRLWVQTEVIKAHLAMVERGVPGSGDMAAAMIDGLFGAYLKDDGTWCDQINACGAAMATTIPVSTFYHILCMAAEAERVSRSGSHD